MNLNWKIYKIDLETGQAQVVKVYERVPEQVVKERCAGFNRLAGKSQLDCSLAYCYVEQADS